MPLASADDDGELFADGESGGKGSSSSSDEVEFDFDDQPTPLPTYQPTPLPTYQPTPLPTYQPTPLSVSSSASSPRLLLVSSSNSSSSSSSSSVSVSNSSASVSSHAHNLLLHCRRLGPSLPRGGEGMENTAIGITLGGCRGRGNKRTARSPPAPLAGEPWQPTPAARCLSIRAASFLTCVA